ncbi:Mrp21 [Kluyveromyces lactis]|nr:Mrp21 [Kluyveromyces lactis]
MLTARGFQLGTSRTSTLLSRQFTQCAVRRQEIIDYTRLTPLSKSAKESSNGSRKDMSFSAMMQSPREDALSSKLTGIQAGRTIDVFSGNTMAAFQRLGSIVRSNSIQKDKRAQRFYLKPGKARELRKSQKHRKEFMKSFKNLIEVVKDAKRKGY